jgi:predicted PurR-regulated permease PerM
LSFVLNPIIKKINNIKCFNKKIPRWVAVILVYLISIIILIIIAIFFIPEIYKETTNLTKDTTDIVNKMNKITIQSYTKKIDDFFKNYNIPIEILIPESENIEYKNKQNIIFIDFIQVTKNILNKIMEYTHNESLKIMLQLQNLLSSIVDFLLQFMLIFIIAAFLLSDIDNIYNFLLKLSPKNKRNTFKYILVNLNKRLSGIIHGQLIICLVNSVLTLIGLLLLKVKFAFLLAIIAGICSLVPVFGSIISTIPIFFIGIINSIYTAFLALIWIIAIHALEANFLNPKIMSHSSKVHPILIILALITGKYYYGIFGALLAVPITSITAAVFNSILIKIDKLDNNI